VNCSPALKWLVLPLLALTLTWKLAVRVDDASSAEKDNQAEVARFLVRQHFVVAASEKIVLGRPDIQATAGTCRLLITQSPPVGWDHDMLHRLATAGDRVFVVFHGKVYQDEPKLLAIGDALWARFGRQVGLKVRATPVLTVIATTICDAERLPWEQLN
jgi:hypothetical protein